MPEPAERFIDAVVRPLADNPELEIGARHQLAEALAAETLLDPEALESAAARLEATPPPSRPPPWKLALYAATLIASVVCIGLGGRSLILVRQFSDLVYDMARWGPAMDDKQQTTLTRGLNPDHRLLLFGDTSKASPSEKFKALWDSDLQNPAYFADYTIRLQDRDQLPPDFLATAEKIDPDNAWFTLQAAADLAKRAVKRDPLTSAQRQKGAKLSIQVIDQAAFEEAVALLQHAASQPRFDSYQGELTARRIALLPNRTDFASQLLLTTYLAGQPSDTFRLRSLVDLAGARAEQLSTAGDADGFREMLANWTTVLERWNSNPSASLIDGMLLRSVITTPAAQFQESAEALEMTDKAVRWQAIRKQAEIESEERNRRASGEDFKMRAGLFAGFFLPAGTRQSERAPRITDQDLKPSRLVDHELFSRIFSGIAWLALGLMLAAAALYRFKTGPLYHQLARSLERLLRPADYAWILGAGVVLPFLYYLAIYRLTPLGARDWSVAASGFIVPAGQFGAMALLMIVIPVLVARWRLRLRGIPSGSSRRCRWLFWTTTISGILAIPAFGLILLAQDYAQSFITIGTILIGILIVVWLDIALRALFSRQPRLLRRLILARALVPAYAFGMLLMALSMPVYHAAERHWIARDRLLEITPEAPAMSRYEYEVAQAMREDLGEILRTLR